MAELQRMFSAQVFSWLQRNETIKRCVQTVDQSPAWTQFYKKNDSLRRFFIEDNLRS